MNFKVSKMSFFSVQKSLTNLATVKGKSNFIKEKYVVPKQGKEHGYLGSRMDAIILNIFEINYSQLIQYEILEKLVT